MVCIYCGGKTQVTNSRGSAKTTSTWRRRQCLKCQSVVTTREQVDLTEALRVKTAAGRLEPFLRAKLFISLHNALSHRKTALSDATQLTDTIVSQLLKRTTGGVLEISDLKDTALKAITRFDKPAGTYYKAHHG